MIAKAIDEDTCYRCFLAGNWNGELVVYAQVATTPGMSAVLRDHWLAQGYAIAIASYVPAEHSRRDRAYHLRQVQGLFSRRCGQPQSVHEIDSQEEHKEMELSDSVLDL
jgi:hypothetical protein